MISSRRLGIDKTIALVALVCAIVFASGCLESALPPVTIVMGEQEVAEDDTTPAVPDNLPTDDDETADDPAFDDPADPHPTSLMIDNIRVLGYLTQGQPSAISLSCTAYSPNGTVQSVVADFSRMGGPKDVMLKLSGNTWIWSGIVATSIGGSAMVFLTATDDTSSVATQTASIPIATTTPNEPPSPPPVPTKPDGTNIALGCPYTWNVAPNYSECTDPGDARQLTDGHRTTGSTPEVNASAVGWTLHPHEHAWVAITIDLGQVQPIRGVLFSAIAGSYYNVDWPMAIAVLVSDDGARYSDAGELVTLSTEYGLPTYNLHASHAYRTDRLATHGRYVRFVVANHPHILVDEIEVYQGDPAVLTASLAGNPVVDMPVHIKHRQLQAGIIRRIVLDAQSVRSQVAGCAYLAPTEREQLVSELTAIMGQAVHLPPADPSTFRAVLPLNNLHAQVFSIQARLWRALGRFGLTPWQSPLWDPLGPTEIPGTDLPGVGITLMQNEYRSGAFNLSNAGDSDLAVNVRIQGLPGGTNPSYVTVHEVAWTDTWRGVPAAAALPKAARSAGGFLISVPSGMTRQVWLTVHAVGVAAGTYQGMIVVDRGSAGTTNIPLQLRVSPVRFPARPTLSLGGWDYTDGDYWLGVTPANQPAMIPLLREHFVDTPWAAGWRVMPNPVSFEGFDAWVARWPDARQYCIALAVGTELDGHPMGTREFDGAVASWISAYVRHWRDDLHLDLNRIALQISDEPETLLQVSKIKAWAKAIKAAVPEIQIWENPGYKCPADAATLDLIDVFCVERSNFVKHETYRNTYRNLARQPGKTLQFYTGWGPIGGLDPYSYYRLQAWNCWAEGATTMFFWSFADGGGASCWNEYISTKRNYTPLFLDAATVTTSRQMEAIREGVEDFEYLVMLENRILELQTAGNAAAPLAEARTLLAQSAIDVLDAAGTANYFWTGAKDRGVADQVRVRILDMLEALN